MAPERPSIAAEVAAAVARFRLVLGGDRARGRVGERRGLGVGGSQEFHDFRDYVPGDDLRHLDWRGYARTEQLRVRLHREEIAPHVDVLLDTSASMASTAPKERAARLLAAGVLAWSSRTGSAARALALGGGEVRPEQVAFDGAALAPALPALPLRSGGVRVLVTDALWPESAVAFLQRLGAGAARTLVLHLLDPWELEPTADGAMWLVDCESGARIEAQLDAGTVATYRARIGRLVDDLRSALIARGAAHALLRADGLAAMCQRDLLPAGVVEPA